MEGHAPGTGWCVTYKAGVLASRAGEGRFGGRPCSAERAVHGGAITNGFLQPLAAAMTTWNYQGPPSQACGVSMPEATSRVLRQSQSDA